MRRLIFCFDGSWNRLDTKTHPTNVVLVAESIVPILRDGTQQIVYYDEGVGTQSGEVWRGGIFGKGLINNIREAYRFLIFNYQQGDEIFVFGFSRGAFTAVSFVGFLRCSGILNVNDARQIDEAWKLYRRFATRVDDDPEELRAFRAKYCPKLCINAADLDWRRHKVTDFDDADVGMLRVRYLGVWDTVGSLGTHVIDAFFDRSTDKRYSHFDTEVSETVEKARHAVSLDERRLVFMPTLWRNLRALNEAKAVSHYSDDAPYQQRWFPGDHGSVGGGGPERGLSNAALHWVLRGAIDQGLRVKLDERSQLRTIRYDQRSPLRNTPVVGWWGKLILGAKALISADRSGPAEAHEISNAALRRWFTPAEELPERQNYRPGALSALAKDIAPLSATFVPLETKADEAVTEYTVRNGDTLSKIARDQLHDITRHPEIFALNRDRIDDPNDIFPDEVLRLPSRDISPDSAATIVAPVPN